MEPFDHLRTLISRWRLVLATVLVAASIAWFTSPAEASGPDASGSYTARAVLVRAAGSEQSVTRVGVFVTSGVVPERAAAALGYTGSPAVLADRVQVSPDDTIGTLEISVTDDSAARAVRIADEFVRQTQTWMRQQSVNAAAQSEQVQILAEQVKQTRAALIALTNRDNNESAALRQAELAAATAAWTNASQRLAAATTDAQAAAAPLAVVQSAVAVPDGSTGFAPPTSRVARTALAALGGLALGVVLALVVARIDTRLRRRAEVQAAYGLPVLSEIPNVPWWRRPSRPDTVVLDAADPVADAYRPLRSAISLTEPVVLAPGHDVSHALTSSARSSVPGVIVVVSARSGEGRTTVAVHLAACLAESGKRVLVIDADVQRPRAHRLLGVPFGLGLTDLEGDDVASLVRASVVPRVRLLQAGTGSHGVALLPLTLPRVVAAARKLADVVVVDCPPLLDGTEAMDAMANADAALVVCRAGRTSRDDAERAQELLARVRVPVFGVALLGTRVAGSLPFAGTLRNLLRRDTGQVLGQPPAQPLEQAPRVQPGPAPEVAPVASHSGAPRDAELVAVASTSEAHVDPVSSGLPIDRVGTAEARASVPPASGQTTGVVSQQQSPPTMWPAAGVSGAKTPNGVPESGTPSRPTPPAGTSTGTSTGTSAGTSAGGLRSSPGRSARSVPRRTTGASDQRSVAPSAARRMRAQRRGDR